MFKKILQAIIRFLNWNPVDKAIYKESTGYIHRDPLPGEYISGLNSKVTHEDRNPSADWGPYKTKGERQYTKYADFMRCVAESCLNDVETSVNKMIADKIITKDYIKDYLDDDGDFQLSKRFLAKLSNTTRNGNYLSTVAETLRTKGVVAERDYPTTPDLNWAKHYKPLTRELKNKAKKFLDLFKIQYEWIPNIPEEIERAHRHTPLQMTIPICHGYKQKNIKSCSNKRLVHAVASLNPTNKFLDSYEPFVKQPDKDYYVGYRLKIVVTPKKKMMKLIKDPNSGNVYFMRDEKKILIGDYNTYDSFLGILWNKKIEDIEPISAEEFNKIPKGGVLLFANSALGGKEVLDKLIIK